jgi:tetratricopeptide (TPR) repeat protein
MTSHALLVTVCLAFTAIAPVRAGSGDTTALSDFERRLAGDADNIALANEYRLAVIRTGEYDRALRFFTTLVRTHPNAPNARLNFGFAYVDKIPAAGAITQVILANSALTQFTRAIDLQKSWIAYYTRGASYLFWPPIFGRTALGIADLEEAMRIQQREPRRSYHVRTFIALGDGYWRLGNAERARATWREGLQEFPDNDLLRARLHADDAAAVRMIDEAFDPTRRVDTDLSGLWSES